MTEKVCNGLSVCAFVIVKSVVRTKSCLSEVSERS